MARDPVAVIGLGKVGLPLACHLARLGYPVSGYDLKLPGPMPWEPGVNEFRHLVGLANSLGEALEAAAFALVVVPTPLEGGRLSSRHVREVLGALHTGPGTTWVVVSTLDPREAAEVCGRPEVVYCPAMVRLGSVMADLARPPVRLVGGLDGQRLLQALDLWDSGPRDYPVVTSDAVTIALAKLAINVTLSARVAWANELARVARDIGADPEDVTFAVGSDRRIGREFMVPGWPPAGPCLPRDLEVWRQLPWASMAGAAYRSHLQTKQDILDALVHRLRKAADPPRVCILGYNYRPGVPDATETLGFSLREDCRELGWEVRALDVRDPGAQEAVDWANVVVVMDPAAHAVRLAGKEVIDAADRYS